MYTLQERLNQQCLRYSTNCIFMTARAQGECMKSKLKLQLYSQLAGFKQLTEQTKAANQVKYLIVGKDGKQQNDLAVSFMTCLYWESIFLTELGCPSYIPLRNLIKKNLL